MLVGPPLLCVSRQLLTLTQKSASKCPWLPGRSTRHLDCAGLRDRRLGGRRNVLFFKSVVSVAVPHRLVHRATIGAGHLRALGPRVTTLA